MLALYFDRFGGPEVLRLGELERPKPGPGQALLRVSFTGINFVDTLLFRGLFNPRLALPHVNGVEAVGFVEAVGPGVDESLVGRRVAANPNLGSGRILGEHAWGGQAQFVVVPADRCVEIPEGLDEASAAATIVSLGSPYDALIRDGELKPGETLLVWAAGSSTGAGALQVGRLLGARIIATAGSPEKMERARRLGAEHVLDHYRQDVAREVRRITGGRGANVIFESTGASTLQKSIEASAEAARIVVYGVVTGYRAQIELGRIIMKRIRLVGSLYGLENHELLRVLELVARGRMEPVVAEAVGLEEVPRVYSRVEAGEVFGKVLIRVS